VTWCTSAMGRGARARWDVVHERDGTWCSSAMGRGARARWDVVHERDGTWCTSAMGRGARARWDVVHERDWTSCSYRPPLHFMRSRVRCSRRCSSSDQLSFCPCLRLVVELILNKAHEEVPEPKVWPAAADA
jgi:hypothetical protein